jgi:hypothetical protein
VRLPRRGRILATAALVVVAVANTLGTSFGVGGLARISLPGASSTALDQPGYVTFYSNTGFLVAGPHRDGDLLAMLQALRRNGVRGVIWPGEQSRAPDFSRAGVSALSQVAGLEVLKIENEDELGPGDAVLIHIPINPNEEPPCVQLDDGTGVWVRLGNPSTPGSRDYCPLPKPHFYGP